MESNYLVASHSSRVTPRSLSDFRNAADLHDRLELLNNDPDTYDAIKNTLAYYCNLLHELESGVESDSLYELDRDIKRLRLINLSLEQADAANKVLHQYKFNALTLDEQSIQSFFIAQKARRENSDQLFDEWYQSLDLDVSVRYTLISWEKERLCVEIDLVQQRIADNVNRAKGLIRNIKLIIAELTTASLNLIHPSAEIALKTGENLDTERQKLALLILCTQSFAIYHIITYNLIGSICYMSNT